MKNKKIQKWKKKEEFLNNKIKIVKKVSNSEQNQGIISQPQTE